MKPISNLLAIENDLYEDFQRCAVQLCTEKIEGEEWDWDSYFLMQHHGGPTRLLDWSDGALVALHFALRNKDRDDANDAIVYVLEPYRLDELLDALPEVEIAKKIWKDYVKGHGSSGLDEDEWERLYLPADEQELRELPTPQAPLLLDFPHITRRVAAQRSRFMVFGTAPDWLSARFAKREFPIRAITIDASSIHKIKLELRESGVTESVIYPDLDGLGREKRQLWEDWK